jgi:hypothetical protein
MTRVRFLDRLHAGDLIIVRGGGDAPLRLQSLAILPGRSGTTERSDAGKARKLLDRVIAFHKAGKKK